nr:hypothetical protein [Caldilineaceae bacterium]
PTAESVQSAEVTAVETPSAESTPTAPVDPYPADQGCYLFQNGLPVALTVMINAEAGDFSQSIDLPANGEAPYCFDPGTYRYIIRYQINAESAPAEVPGEFTVNAGDRFMFPIRAQQ